MSVKLNVFSVGLLLSFTMVANAEVSNSAPAENQTQPLTLSCNPVEKSFVEAVMNKAGMVGDTHDEIPSVKPAILGFENSCNRILFRILAKKKSVLMAKENPGSGVLNKLSNMNLADMLKNLGDYCHTLESRESEQAKLASEISQNIGLECTEVANQRTNQRGREHDPRSPK